MTDTEKERKIANKVDTVDRDDDDDGLIYKNTKQENYQLWRILTETELCDDDSVGPMDQHESVTFSPSRKLSQTTTTN